MFVYSVPHLIEIWAMVLTSNRLFCFPILNFFFRFFSILLAEIGKVHQIHLPKDIKYITM